MIPIIVCNTSGEITGKCFDYCMGVEACKYLDTLFNNKAIVYDYNTLNGIDYSRYNSLPILCDDNYGIDILGVINIHSREILTSYLGQYDMVNKSFILSEKDYLLGNINNFGQIMIIYSKLLDRKHGTKLYFDKNIWIGKKEPEHIDNDTMVYTVYNKIKILTAASIQLKRLLYPHEREVILNSIISGNTDVSYLNYLPILKS